MARNPKSVELDLTPASVTPPGQAVLRVTHVKPGSALFPGEWHTLAISASGNGSEKTVSVGLLVGGSRVYLPLLTRAKG